MRSTAGLLAGCALLLAGALGACAPEVYAPPTPPESPKLAPKLAPELDAPESVPTFFPESCAVQPPREFAPHFVGASFRHRVGACDLAKQTRAESAFDPNAVSYTGCCVGISQFDPVTAAELGFDPWDPEQAIYGQARYVRWCRDRWDPDLEGRTADDIEALGLLCYVFGLGNAYENQRRWGWVTWAQAEPYAPAEAGDYVLKIMGPWWRGGEAVQQLSAGQ